MLMDVVVAVVVDVSVPVVADGVIVPWWLLLCPWKLKTTGDHGRPR